MKKILLILTFLFTNIYAINGLYPLDMNKINVNRGGTLSDSLVPLIDTNIIVHEIDNKTGHMKRFENLGIPMFLLHERVTYDTDDDVVEIDEMIDTNDHAMLSEDIYNILLQNVITNHSINNEETDKKKKKAKNEKTTKKTQKKIQKTTTKTQKKNRK